MNAKLSGIYKSCWEYPEKGKIHESVTVLLHLSDDSIIGFEIYDGKKCKKYGGIYFLFGKMEVTTIKGKWQKFNSPEYGEFTLTINDKNELEGTYNLLHPTAPDKGKVDYYYSMQHLIDL